MSGRRKDSKRHVLKDGESQRKDGRYQYRYTDIYGKRKYIYASTLNDLREKETKLKQSLSSGLDYAGGEITVYQQTARYVSMKNTACYQTKRHYQYVLTTLKGEPFAAKCIRDVKVSDAQRWVGKLQQDGKCYSTISGICSVVSPAFQLAYEDDIISRNPFNFKLHNIIRNDSKQRQCMTPEQQERLMNFARTDNVASKHYDIFAVLLYTGMRVSELCGLTISDVDLKERVVHINHQLLKLDKGKYAVTTTKSKSGCRDIPISELAYQSLKNLIANRQSPKQELIIDGYSGFVLLNRNGKPKDAHQIQDSLRRTIIRYNEKNPDNPLPNITPHMFRHTFCTNMANSGLDTKALQYLMGHSNASTTMNIYAHSSYAHAAEQMRRLDFSQNAKKCPAELA